MLRTFRMVATDNNVATYYEVDMDARLKGESALDYAYERITQDHFAKEDFREITYEQMWQMFGLYPVMSDASERNVGVWHHKTLGNPFDRLETT